jgi:hypothetical protein
MARIKGGINRAVLKRQLKRGVMKSSKTKELARKQALKSFEMKKRKLLSDFDNHSVTREIKAGPRATNSSGTLGGHGNLFSFIGFDSGYDPISPVRDLLVQETRLLKSPKVNTRGDDIVFEFGVRYPTKDRLASVSPMPWEPGSWLLKIEKGISGVGHYIYKSFLEGVASRSGTGVQSKKKINSGMMYRRTSYISLILNTFRASLK